MKKFLPFLLLPFFIKGKCDVVFSPVLIHHAIKNKINKKELTTIQKLDAIEKEMMQIFNEDNFVFFNLYNKKEKISLAAINKEVQKAIESIRGNHEKYEQLLHVCNMMKEFLAEHPDNRLHISDELEKKVDPMMISFSPHRYLAYDDSSAIPVKYKRASEFSVYIMKAFIKLTK